MFVTGHTGFKGGWLIFWLQKMGAEVCGYARAPLPGLSLYRCIRGEELCQSHLGDVADFGRLKEAFDAFRPEIVIHLAAQAIVREGYRAPRDTYLTNLMGTVNLLECVRLSPAVRSVLNVTTDKVYKTGNGSGDTGKRTLWTVMIPIPTANPVPNSRRTATAIPFSISVA